MQREEMSFYICQCKSCGRHGVKEITKSKQLMTSRFRCHPCNKSFKLKRVGILGFALNVKGPYASGLKAAAKCAELNAEGK